MTTQYTVHQCNTVQLSAHLHRVPDALQQLVHLELFVLASALPLSHRDREAPVELGLEDPVHTIDTG